MRQLNPIDGQFVSAEKFTAPEHIGLLIIYDQSDLEDGPLRFKEILRRFETRIDQCPVFTNKIDKVPLNLDQPYWVEEAEFDLEYHVMHMALPQPGDWRQLCIQLARLHSRGLDMTRPLWQAYVIEGINAVEGLPQGSFALYLKIHHSAADGMSINNVLTALHDLKPIKVSGEFGSQLRKRIAEPGPTNGQKLSRAFFNWAQLPIKLASAGAELAATRSKTRDYNANHGRALASGKPRTRFDAPISAQRVFEARRFNLADAMSIRKMVPGAALNDVAVATISLAVSKYLGATDELPSEAMVGWIPVSLRTEQDSETIGNEITTLAVPIHTDIADPAKLLSSVTHTTENAKRFREEVGNDPVTSAILLVPAPFQKYIGQINTLTTKLGTPTIPANLTITNVPGPRVPIYLAGAKAIEIQGVGMIQDGHGLFNIISTYCDKLQISVTSCRDMMPDPDFYAQCIEDAFAELLKASQQRRS